MGSADESIWTHVSLDLWNFSNSIIKSLQIWIYFEYFTISCGIKESEGLNDLEINKSDIITDGVLLTLKMSVNSLQLSKGVLSDQFFVTSWVAIATGELLDVNEDVVKLVN